MKSGAIGTRLREAREAAGLSQRSLADRANVGAATIAHIELGRQIPSADTVERLALALGVRPAWLAYADGEPEPA